MYYSATKQLTQNQSGKSALITDCKSHHLLAALVDTLSTRALVSSRHSVDSHTLSTRHSSV